MEAMARWSQVKDLHRPQSETSPGNLVKPYLKIEKGKERWGYSLPCMQE